jgi:hypothetical protein
LRRRTSASSMDSSGCLTPLTSPSTPIIHLQTDHADLSYADVWDKNVKFYPISSMFMRSQ